MKDRICEAVRFAVDHYEKAGIGRDNNYFFPPMEMLSILNGMNMAKINEDLMAAGILFHTVEDTDATIEMIAERFGSDVAGLVGKHLEYLSPGFEEGTQKLVREMKDADVRFRLLMLCDTVVRQRRLKHELEVMGGEAWEKQEMPVLALCTYFSSIQDELYDLQFDDVLAPVYWEMVDTFKDLFVTFYYDREMQRMIQVCADGSRYVIARSDLQAKPLEGDVPETAITVARRYAERIEDNWSEDYDLQNHAEDFSFEEYYVAVKNHVRGFLKDTVEDDLDRLLITNVDFIRERYNREIEKLANDEVTMDIYLTEGPAKTADALERLAGADGNIIRKMPLDDDATG